MGQAAKGEGNWDFFIKSELKSIFLVCVIGVILQKDEFSWSFPLYSDLCKSFTKEVLISLMGFSLQFLYIHLLLFHYFVIFCFNNPILNLLELGSPYFLVSWIGTLKALSTAFCYLRFLSLFFGCKWSSWILCFVNVIDYSIYLRMLLRCPGCVADITKGGEQFLEKSYLFAFFWSYLLVLIIVFNISWTLNW